MLEKQIEVALREAVKQRGGLCIKVTSPSMNGLPDRLVILPHGLMGFVELKAPGKKPRLLQAKRIRELQALGGFACSIDSIAQIEGILEVLMKVGEA